MQNKKQKTNETFLKNVKKWIPGTTEYERHADAELEKYKKSSSEYSKKELERLEKLWRTTIRKAEKDWRDNLILNAAGVWNEKDLDKLMEKLKETYLSDAKPVSIGEKENFISILLRMLMFLQ